MYIMYMKPFFKYPGGKQREIKHILNYIPSTFDRIVEPFAGGSAVSFHFEIDALIADINDNVINIYNVVKDNELYQQLLSLVNYHKEIGPSEAEYYIQRDNKYKCEDQLEKAFRFLYLRQLCFSGMYRINAKTGKFNVPFGWYKTFNSSLNDEHHMLLQKWDIKHQSFHDTFKEIKKGDFLYLDPPYYQRNSAYAGGHSMDDEETLHIELYNNLNDCKEKWLIMHNDCELYQDLYKDYTINYREHRYKMNFKGRKNKNDNVKHLYITNY